MAGRVPRVGVCSTRPELRWRFSWCWFFGFFLFEFVYSCISVHSLPCDSYFKPGFFLTQWMEFLQLYSLHWPTSTNVAFGQCSQLLCSCICSVALVLL